MYCDANMKTCGKRMRMNAPKRLRFIPPLCLWAAVALATSGARADAAESLDAMMSAFGAEPQPFSYTYRSKDGSLMIETRCAKQSHGDWIYYKQQFDGYPNVVISAQKNGNAVAAFHSTIAKTKFKIALTDHAGKSVSNAWVLWIAVYPYEYENPATGLIIDTYSTQYFNGEFVRYNQTFPGTPNVVTCAGTDKAKMSAPINHKKNGFTLKLLDDKGKPVDRAWVTYLAVWPCKYDDPSSNLTIESRCGKWGNGKWVSYGQSFPGTPVAVTNAQWGGKPFMSCPVSLARTGFRQATRNHSGGSVSSAWTFFIAVYPNKYAAPKSPADLNGDAVVDVNDLLAALAAWGAADDAPEDLNRDRVVDALDFLDILAAWGPCE